MSRCLPLKQCPMHFLSFLKWIRIKALDIVIRSTLILLLNWVTNSMEICYCDCIPTLLHRLCAKWLCFVNVFLTLKVTRRNWCRPRWISLFRYQRLETTEVTSKKIFLNLIFLWKCDCSYCFVFLVLQQELWLSVCLTFCFS